MIYVSSSCVEAKTIKESVTALAESGFKRIELSGGTQYSDGYEDDLLYLKDKYGLSYLVHGYFPPPPKPFVLNLASLNEEIYDQSIQHCKLAIELSKKLGGSKYSVHAGCFIDLALDEVGRKVGARNLASRETAYKRFSDAWNILSDEAGSNVTLYVENNVISNTNAETYKGTNPFFFTDFQSYLELKKYIDFKPLLDLAHLKVSANSLGVNFNEQIAEMIHLTDYLHISDNDGLHDQNKRLYRTSDLLKIFDNYNLKDKVITLEIYQDAGNLNESYKIISEMVRTQ